MRDGDEMSWLDNLIAFINPEAAAKREAWRQTYEEMRNYDAASYGRANANWYVNNRSAEDTDRYSRTLSEQEQGTLKETAI